MQEVTGVLELEAWFGRWPSFHDAEVISLDLNREGLSKLRVLTWEMTGNLDERGYYVLRKHVLVDFLMKEITDVQLSGFSCQNVISGLAVAQKPDGYEVELYPCFGVAGSITAKELAVHFEPVNPSPK